MTPFSFRIIILKHQAYNYEKEKSFRYFRCMHERFSFFFVFNLYDQQMVDHILRIVSAYSLEINSSSR